MSASLVVHLPEDDHNRWPKHVTGGSAIYNTINIDIFIGTCWFCFS